MQAPVPARLVGKGPDALPPELLHKGGHRGVHAASCGLLRRHLFQPYPAVYVRLHAAKQGGLQGSHHSHGGVGYLPHQVCRQPVHNGVLLTREHGRVGVACGVLGRRLRHLQGLPGLWHPDIELLFNHLWDVFPAV